MIVRFAADGVSDCVESRRLKFNRTKNLRNRAKLLAEVLLLGRLLLKGRLDLFVSFAKVEKAFNCFRTHLLN